MFSIRTATPQDAERIIAILQDIASERIHTAITKPWSAGDQGRYMATLSCREGIHAAVTDRNVLIGYQVLELWSPTLDSMAHVGQIGTFIAAGWRGRGVGTALFRATRDFAARSGYGKFVIQVRSRNFSAQEFYKRQGFRECGRFTRQVRVCGEEDDEILMEFFL